MSSNGQPSWLRDDNNIDPVNPNIPLKTEKISNDTYFDNVVLSNLERNKLILFWVTKVLSIGSCLLMYVTSFFGLKAINSVEDSRKIYVAIYMLFFSTLLLVFEIAGLYKVDWLDHLYHRNFGFLYNSVGKALFIIFVAFLSFGLDTKGLLSFGTGFSLAAYGVGVIALYLKYPELFETQA